MGLFDNILREDESLIINENALDFEFLPKILPFREKEQRFIASSIKPLLSGRTGRNLIMHGDPGIGKTAAARHVVRELEEQTDKIFVFYINCWQNNTTYKILVEICNQLNYKLVQNKKTVDLYKIVSSMINKKTAAFIFDEVDKAEEYDFLYFIMEEIYKKSVCLITNFHEWILGIDKRIMSRMTPEKIEFKQYNEKETKEIMKLRRDYAFPKGVWKDDAFDKIAKKTYELKDIRTGLFLMRESALIAEEKSKKNIELSDVNIAINKIDDFSIKKKTALEEDTQFILDIVKNNSGKKIGDLFNVYEKEGGKHSYKTFQRKISELDKNKFIKAKKQTGPGGNTTIVEKKTNDADNHKKLTEF